MYLFTRSGRFGPGSIREAMTFTAEVTEKVHQESGLEIHAWQASMSPELGTIVWAMFVDSLETLETAQDKLAVSQPFMDLAEQGGRLFVGPLTDGLATVVHGAPDLAATTPPSYVSTARATAATGRLGDAIAAGIEIAETSTRITGGPTMFLMDNTGRFGGCRWTSSFADIGALERAEAALAADESWVALIDRVGSAYEAGATQTVFRRIA